MNTDGTINTDYAIVETMFFYGGGFVKALAQAWRLADSNNKGRIKHAFPQYWAQYDEMTTAIARRQGQVAPASPIDPRD